MDNWWLMLLALPVGAAAAWILMRRKESVELVPQPRARKSAGPIQVARNQPERKPRNYYGVSVQVGNNPCAAARTIADKRYLTEEAPHFPLPECDRRECRCVLRPQNDRRAGYDRRSDSFSAYGNFELDRHTQKRRNKSDRRKSR